MNNTTEPGCRVIAAMRRHVNKKYDNINFNKQTENTTAALMMSECIWMQKEHVLKSSDVCLTQKTDIRIKSVFTSGSC